MDALEILFTEPRACPHLVNIDHNKSSGPTGTIWVGLMVL